MNKEQYQEQQFINYGIKLANKLGIDVQTIDLTAIYDNKLTLYENKRHLLEHLKPDIEIVKEKLAEQQREYIEGLLPQTPTVDISHIYDNLYKAVEKLAKGYTPLVIVKGRAGVGKTRNIEQFLNKFNIAPVRIRDTTDAYLPQILFENNGRVIWFMDCGYKLLRGVDTIETLKAITETEPHLRIVSNNNYNPDKIHIPNEFIFTGSIILDFNKLVDLKYIENYEALVSRGDVVELVFSNKEMVEMMRTIAQTESERETTEFLISNFQFIYSSFNLRTQANAFRDYKFCQENGYGWKDYIYKKIQSQKSQTFTLLYQFMGKEPIRTTELKKWLISSQNMTIRTAERKIKEYLEIGELINIEPMRERDFMVSLYPLSDINATSGKKEGYYERTSQSNVVCR